MSAAAGPGGAGGNADTLGGYEILYQLKAGGMGQVLLGRRVGTEGFERLVALKTIKAELRGKAELRSMFIDEAKLVARISHPCVAQVYDFAEEPDGTLFLAMEYVAGVRFTELARRGVPAAVAARAMAQVCRGLHAAHELMDLHGTRMGVVHRDVTPENLMLTFEGRVKVLDFGIALVRGRSAPATEYGTVKGKPPYLAPEQLKNEPVDARTDIFSAAVVLHELLTGEAVYEGESVYAIARAIENDDVAPPSKLAGPLPAGLDEVVMTSMSRDPTLRFQNALAMAEALERVANASGAESLESYAARELAEDQTEHRRWLRRILADAGSKNALAGRAGRASGVMTALPGITADPAPPTPQTPRAPRSAIEKVASSAHPVRFSTVNSGVSTDDEVRIAHQSRRRIGLLFGFGAVALVAALFFLLPVFGGDGRGDELTANIVTDGGVLMAADTALASVSDAGSVAQNAGPIDATAVPVADAAVAIVRNQHRAGRGTSRRRTPRRASIDAGVVVRRRPPDAAVARPEPALSGLITIAADPFALVRIDGAEIGATPIFRRRIDVGRHEVILIHPDSGKVRLRRNVVVRAGKLVSVVDR